MLGLLRYREKLQPPAFEGTDETWMMLGFLVADVL